MILLILILLFCYIIYLNGKNISASPIDIDEMKMNIYPYSGLNKEIYLKYLNDLLLFSQNIEHVDIATKYLYSAIDRAYELQFFTDHDFTDKIMKNAIKGEELLLESSLRYGNLFIPKYLNNKI